MNINLKTERPDSVQKAINKAVATLMPPRTKVKGGPQARSRNAIKSATTSSLKNGVVANVNTAFTYRNKVPQYTGVKGGVRIRHTEFITDLSAPSVAKTYVSERFNINPANSNLFPWLATAEARSYSTFVPNSLRFIVKSTVATNKDGSAMVVATADVADSVPLTKTQFLKTGDAVRGHVFADFTYTVPDNILHRLPEYLTFSNPDSHSDNTKAVGTLFVGVSGCESALDYGELYVEYDFTLLNTQDTVFSSVKLTNSSFNPTHPFKMSSSSGPSFEGNIFLQCQTPSGVSSSSWLRVDEGGSKIFIFETYLTVSAPGDFFGIIDFFDINGVNINTPIGYDNFVNVKTASTTGSVDGFLVIITAKNLPSPFFMQWSGIGGTYGSAFVHISPHQAHDPIMLTTSDLSERMKRIESLVDDDVVHTYVERTPNPPHNTPVLRRY